MTSPPESSTPQIACGSRLDNFFCDRYQGHDGPHASRIGSHSEQVWTNNKPPAPASCSEVVERLPIVLVGDPVLREIAKPVTGDEQELVDLLCRTMKGAHALGLAAPQIGVSKRVAVVQMSEDVSATVLINPRIIDRLGEEVADEGCLSIPDVRLPIKRWYTISVESNGALIGTFRGLMARAIQHEIDHLDGIMITDRTRELHSWRERRVQELEEAHELFRSQMQKALGIVEDGRVWLGSGLLERARTLVEREAEWREQILEKFEDEIALHGGLGLTISQLENLRAALVTAIGKAMYSRKPIQQQRINGEAHGE